MKQMVNLIGHFAVVWETESRWLSSALWDCFGVILTWSPMQPQSGKYIYHKIRFIHKQIVWVPCGETKTVNDCVKFNLIYKELCSRFTVGLLYSSCVKKMFFLQVTIITKEKEEPNNGALLGTLLFDCIDRFLLLYIICASVPTKGI